MNLRLIHGNSNRVTNSDVIFRSGKFAYKLDVEWAKWPEYLKSIPANSGSFDKNGNLFVATGIKEYPVIKLNSKGELVSMFGKGLFVKSHSAYVTPWNTLLCADNSPDVHMVREVTLTGQVVRNFGELGKPSDTGFNPNAFILAKCEGMIPVDEPWEIMKGYYLMLETITHPGGPCNRPTGMVVSPAGDMFMSDGNGNCAVHRFDNNGNYIKTWGGAGREPGQFRCPHGIWVDKYSRVIVCDRENQRVQVFTTEGKLLVVIDNLILPECAWSDENNIFIGESGGMTILDMELNVVAQIGYEGSNLYFHGIFGKSSEEIFIFSSAKNKVTSISRLIRI